MARHTGTRVPVPRSHGFPWVCVMKQRNSATIPAYRHTGTRVRVYVHSFVRVGTREFGIVRIALQHTQYVHVYVHVLDAYSVTRVVYCNSYQYRHRYTHMHMPMHGCTYCNNAIMGYCDIAIPVLYTCSTLITRVLVLKWHATGTGINILYVQYVPVLQYYPGTRVYTVYTCDVSSIEEHAG